MRGGQSLRFAGPSDVTTKIRAFNGLVDDHGAHIEALHVMRWVMHNTVEATQAGLLEWVKQVCRDVLFQEKSRMVL